MRPAEPPMFWGGEGRGPTGQPAISVDQYVFSVTEWERFYQRALADYGIDAAMQVMMLGRQCAGAAHEWYRFLVTTDPSNPALRSVSNWLVAVKHKFADPNVRLRTMQRLAGLQQLKGRNGLSSYIAAFNECVMTLDLDRADPAGQLRFNFVRGLTNESKSLIAASADLLAMTLDQIQKMLEMREMLMHDQVFFQPPPPPPRYGGYQQPRYQGPTPMELGTTEFEGQGGRRGRGGRGGAWAGPQGPALTPAEKALRAERYEKGQCFKCGQDGHIASNCPGPKPSENEVGAQR